MTVKALRRSIEKGHSKADQLKFDLNVVIKFAQAEVEKKIREDNGSNQDRKGEIAKYWGQTTYKQGFNRRAPYCSAFVAWCFRSAGIKVKPTASCRAMVEWAKSGGTQPNVEARFFTPKAKPKVGDMVLFDTRQKGRYNHIGIVVKVLPSMIVTIEGNTSPGKIETNDPSDNWAGVHRKNRPLKTTPISGYVRIMNISWTSHAWSPTDLIISSQHFLDMIEQNKSGELGIVAIQQMLNELGMAGNYSLKLDGLMGPKTKAALRRLYVSVHKG